MNTVTNNYEAGSDEDVKALAAGVLNQAMQDVRRFRGARTRLERELYRDAYDWIMSHDLSWPFSFLNVCQTLDLQAESTRSQLLSDASLGVFSYWVRRGGRFARSLGSAFARDRNKGPTFLRAPGSHRHFNHNEKANNSTSMAAPPLAGTDQSELPATRSVSGR